MKKAVLLRSCAAFFVPLASGAFIVTPAFAQETSASIRGDVSDNGKPVANATVVVTHLPSGSVSRTTSDSSGTFNAPGLRVGGPYTIVVTANGYEPITLTDAFIQAGEPLSVPVRMVAAAPQQEVITITAARSGAREQSTGPITALGRTQIEGVASVNRDVRDIARRDPFATMDLSNSRTIEIAGNNGRLNRFSVDGAQFSDVFGLNNGGLPTNRGPVPIDAIEQFSVKVAPFDISEGNFQGGSINVILRSGTNKFHGGAFYSYSDAKLSGSRVGLQTVDLTFKSKQHGFNVAGPIFKDRLFFMVAYEKTKETTPFDSGVGPGFGTQIPGITQGNIDQVTSIASSVYGYDTQGLISAGTEGDEKYVVKLDANVTDKHRASITFIHDNGTNQFQQNNFATSPAGLGLQSNGYQLGEITNTGVFQLNSQWTDRFSSEFRTTYNEYERNQTPFGGNSISQFEVCLDPVSAGTLTSCGGSRLFFGPDVSRQANDLNLDTLNVEFRPKLSLGNHTLKGLMGYQRSHTYNLFLQRATGDLYFDSLADFQARRASRLRLGGAVPTLNPADAAANFNASSFTAGIQDDWNLSDAFQVTAGVRYDYYFGSSEVPLNPNFVTRYGFDNRSTFDGRGLVQPRLGFNWKATPRLIIKGGSGVFGGGTPQVFLSNSYSNTGLLTNQVDIARAAGTPGCTASGATAAQLPALCAALNGVTGLSFPTAVTNYLATNTASLALAPVNAIDPDIKLASQWRSSLSVNYNANLPVLGDNWLFGADLLYSKILKAYQWTDIRSVPIGTLPDGRTRYGPLNGVATTNQDLLMTNSNRGRSIIAVLRASKVWDWGLAATASYTRQNVKDENALTSSTAGSLYSNNALLDPNRAAYGRSIYEIKDSYKVSFDYNHAFFGTAKTRFSVFGDWHSGRPYSITGLDRGTGRLPVYGTVGVGGRPLLFVPNLSDPRVSFDTLATQDAFNALVTQLNLDKYRGSIVPKNSQRSPHFFKVDLHASQEIPIFVGGGKIELFADIENFGNFLNKRWGSLRQVGFPYTAAAVTVQCLSVATATGTAPGAGVVNTSSNQTCAQYRYSQVTSPIQTLSTRVSLYQIRIGAKLKF